MAALVLCFMASGAMAYEEKVVTLDPWAVDTLLFVASTKVVRTLPAYLSKEIGVSQDYQYISGHIFQTLKDTATATGFSRDSIYFTLQSRSDRQIDSIWHTLWTSNLMPCASFDSTTGWARGDGGRIYIPADSVGRMQNLFRIQYYIVANIDSIRSVVTLTASSKVDPYMVYNVFLAFREGAIGESIILRTDRLDSDSLTGVGGAHTGDTLYLAANAAYVEKDTSVAIDALYWEAATTLFHVFGNGEDGSDSSDYVLHWQGSIDGTTWALLDSTVAIADSLPHVDEISLFTPIKWFRAILVARDGNLKDGESFGIVDIYSRARKNR